MSKLNQKVSYDTVYVNPGFITITHNTENLSNVQYENAKSHDNLKNNRTQGVMSFSAQKNIQRCINWFYSNSPLQHYYNNRQQKNVYFKLAFITLTLPAPQKHSDIYIKDKMLNQFLTEMRQVKKIKEYVWRAERQQNGRIHFHIIVNKFFYHNHVRTMWNRICAKEGYVQDYQKEMTTRYKNGFFSDKYKIGSVEYLKEENAYYKGVSENWTNPPSTEAKEVLNTKKLNFYVSKYLKKNSCQFCEQVIRKMQNDRDCSQFLVSSYLSDLRKVQEEKGIKGRLWFCCQKYAKIKNFIMPDTEKLRSEIQSFLKLFKSKVRFYDMFTVLLVNFEEYKRLKLYGLFEWFTRAKDDYFNNSEIPLCVT